MQTNLQPVQNREPESPNTRDAEPYFTLIMRDAGGGRVSLYLDAVVSPETAARINAVIDEEDRRSGESLSIDMLAAELDVTRRSIERALKDGTLVPTWQKGKRARFSREYVDRLKERAHEARLRGFKHIIGVAAATGPIVGAVRVQRTQKSASQWARATLWKLRHTRRRNPRPKAGDTSAKPRPARAIERLAPEEIEARARLAADRAKLKAERVRRTPEQERQIVLLSINPYIEPESRDQALRTISLLLRLVRAHPGEDAARIKKALDGFRVALVQNSRRKLIPSLTTLKEAIPCAHNLESQCANAVHKALANLVAWCERRPALSRNRTGRKRSL